MTNEIYWLSQKSKHGSLHHRCWSAKSYASYSWLYRLRLILGVKYTVVFLILVFYKSFSLFLGILEGLFGVIWYLTTPLADPVYSRRYS